MAQLTFSSSLLLLTCSLILHLVSPSKVLHMLAHPGEDVTLWCQGPADVAVAALEWTRTDLGAEEHVLFYRDGRLEAMYQHSFFEHRVELRERSMRNGDLSVILRNVTKADGGTYECRFRAAGAKRRKRAIIPTEPLSIIQLQVVLPGDLNALAGDKLTGSRHEAQEEVLPLQLALVSAVFVGIFVIIRKRRAH